MVKVKAKLVRIGNSFGFIVPKPYVDNGELKLETKYSFEPEVCGDEEN